MRRRMTGVPCQVRTVSTRRVSVVLFAVGLLLVGCGRRGAPTVPVLIEPSPPTDLEARIQRRAVVLSWSRPATNVDGTPLRTLVSFRILRQQRGPDTSAPSVLVTVKADGPENAVASGNRYAFTDADVVVGRRYAYLIQSVNRRGIIGPTSPEASVVVTVEIEAPSDLRAEVGEGTVRLSWSAPLRRGDGGPLDAPVTYNIYRGTMSGDYGPRPVNREPVRGAEFQDSDLVHDRMYYYIVRAVENAHPPWQEGLSSLEVSAMPVDLTPPAPPRGVRAVTGPGTVVSLSWEPSQEPDLLGYLVYRSDGPSRRPRRLLDQPFRVPAVNDRSVRSGGHYIYTVTAVDASSRRNESGPSDDVEVVVPSSP